MVRELTGPLEGGGLRFGIVVSRFNRSVTSSLLSGALEALAGHGVADDDVLVAHVPGAFEIPYAAKRLAHAGQYDAIICLGAVVRGETPHFDYICAEASRGLSLASSDYDIPIGFGLLTCDTMEQAEERAGGEHGNKGWDAAIAALEMSDLFERLDGADEG